MTAAQDQEKLAVLKLVVDGVLQYGAKAFICVARIREFVKRQDKLLFPSPCLQEI